MNDYQVTYNNGETEVISAWTAEVAQVIAEEDVEGDGRGLTVVAVNLLTPQPAES